MSAETIILAVGLAASAGTAIALAIRSGGLLADNAVLGEALAESQSEHVATSEEFDSYRVRVTQQLKGLRDEINDLEDLLDACGDPGVLRSRLEQLLQAAAGIDGGQGAD